MQSQRRARVISRGWVQAVLLVALFGFSVLGFIAARTYQAEPPIPERVTSPTGELVFTGEDVRVGQEVFLRNGIMQYGSIFGHGAYLGPDFTADYLPRSALDVGQPHASGGAPRVKLRKKAPEEQDAVLRQPPLPRRGL